MNSKNLKGLCEAYGGIYTPQELTEEQVWEEVETWVSSLIEEGYDLSDYTWEEMFESYIEEQGGRGGAAIRNSSVAKNPVSNYLRSIPNPFLMDAGGRVKPTSSRVGNIPSQEGTGRGAPGSGMALDPGRFAREKARLKGVGNPKTTDTPPAPDRGSSGSSSATRAAASSSRPAPTAAPAKPAATAQTGDKAKDMATFAKANPALAAASAERARTRGTSATTNPLMRDMKSRMPAPSTPSPTTTSTAFSKSTPSLSKPLSSSSNYSSAKVSPSANVIGKKDQKPLASSFEWGSTSKLVNDIAGLYQSVYEAKKVDQDEDGDNDFADVRIARLIASGVPKEKAIEMVKNKSYNEEVEIDEATRMRKELGKEGETATRKELARRSNAYQRSGSVDRTIAAAERGAKNPYVAMGKNETEVDYSKRKQQKSKTLTRLASNRRGSVRDKPRAGLRGYAAKVEGDDRDLQSARSSARSAGTLTPAEKKGLGEEFDLWVNALIYEGYDLSEYTWDEMIEIYEETEEERKRNERRARVAELQAQGRVMTSSKRASQKAAQRKQEKKEEMADRLLRSIQASGSTRSSSAPMGTTEPEEKPEAPAANRKLGGKVKKDDLASQANAILRTIKNENIQLWVNELINEGYDLTGWTGKEITKLYFEIFE